MNSKLFVPVTDSIHPYPKSSWENSASQMVYEFWWWWKAKIDWRSTCSCNCQRCQTHKFRRGMKLSLLAYLKGSDVTV